MEKFPNFNKDSENLKAEEKDPTLSTRKPEERVEPILTEKKSLNIDNWRERLDQAKNIKGLQKVITGAEIIQDENRDYSPLEVYSAIGEAEAWLHSHFDQIVIGVLTGGYETERNELGRLTRRITRGGELNIRQKVVDLMKQEMEDYFLETKPALARRAIGEMKSLDELQKLLKQFKYISRANGDKVFRGRYEGQLNWIVDQTVRDFESQTTANYWSGVTSAQVPAEITEFLDRHRVPEGAGLRDKMLALMTGSIIKNKIKESSSSSSSSSNPKPKTGSWLGRLARRFLGRR